jgi:hypothetical protein
VYQILEVGDEWNILKCTLHSRRVQKISITLAILEELFVNSVLHDTKIPMGDMKVLVYSSISKKKFMKKMKSPSSMRNGRFHPSICRGKVQEMGVLYTHSSQMSGPSPNFLIKPKKKPPKDEVHFLAHFWSLDRPL